MSLRQFLIAIFGIYLVFNLIGLFLQEFNHVKIVIFANIVLIFLGIIGILYFSRFLFIKREKPFEKFVNILEAINTPICLYDNEMKIIYVNKAFEEFTGLKKDALLSLQLDTWVTKNPIYTKLSLVFFPSLIATKIQAREDNKDIVEVNYKDEIVFDLITTKLRFDKEEYNSKIIIDKSILFKEIKNKNEFVSLISHHLRTPLNQIRWFLESLAKSENIPEEEKESIKNFLNLISKSIALVESILLTSRVEEKKIELSIEENDIEELILSCLSLLNFEINEKKLKVNIEIEEEVKRFPFDKKILFFALYPIIENAVDYNKIGGEINIKVEKDKEKSEVKISIEDTGIGISEKDLLKMFEKFYRSLSAKEIKPTGTGIGLYLAKNLINIHKGTISITSEEGKGTKVLISLPSYKEVYL